MVLAVASVPCVAAEFSPASFAAKAEWEKSISFPEGKANVLALVPCSAVVSIEGRLTDLVCFSVGKQMMPYARAVLMKQDDAVLMPASVDKQTQAVYMHFSVLVSRLLASEVIHVMPNHGRNDALFGDNYVDPQIYAGEFPRNAWPCLKGNGIAWTAMLVTAEGRAIDVKIERDRLPTYCRDELTGRIRDWRFIPASHDGKAVDMLYSSAILDADSTNKEGIVRIQGDSFPIEPSASRKPGRTICTISTPRNVICTQ